jgi:phospholipase A1/A2
MGNSDSRFSHIASRLSVCLCGTVFLFLLPLIFSGYAHADMATRSEKCAATEKSDDKKLKCNYNIAKQNKNEPSDKNSMMEKLWDLDEKSREKTPMIRGYHPNYFLFVAYNSTPNRSMMLDVDPEAIPQNTEAKFQLSGKVRLFPKLGKYFDFWVAYTQISFWQLYNSPFSSPFRDTDYEPEGFFTYRTKRYINLFDSHLLDLRIINVGFVHQSNGRARPLSRSWNRVFAEFGFERVFDREQKEGRNEFDLFVKLWYRIPEDRQNDDNPDIEKYLGYGEIHGIYYWKTCRFGMMLRNNLRTGGNKGALQIDMGIPFGSIPLLKCFASNRFSLYIQYVNGYGESLLDYNSSSNRLSAGIMITNWDS